MSVTIRRATIQDVPVLAEMRYAFRVSLGEAREDEREFVRRVGEWMCDRLSASQSWFAWVATLDGQVIGNIWLERVEKMPNPIGESEHLGYITNMFVLPEHQSGGVGSALLHALVEFADRERFHTLILWPSPKSRAFYTRHGFEPQDKPFIRVSPAAVHP